MGSVIASVVAAPVSSRIVGSTVTFWGELVVAVDDLGHELVGDHLLQNWLDQARAWERELGKLFMERHLDLGELGEDEGGFAIPWKCLFNFNRALKGLGVVATQRPTLWSFPKSRTTAPRSWACQWMA